MTAKVMVFAPSPKIEKTVRDVWQKLEEIGLAAPQVTYLMHELKEEGFPVDCDATTIEEAKAEILKLC